MSLAWKQEFRLAVDEQFDWPALLRALSHAENGSARSFQAASQDANPFSVSQEDSPLGIQAAAVDLLESMFVSPSAPNMGATLALFQSGDAPSLEANGSSAAAGGAVDTRAADADPGEPKAGGSAEAGVFLETHLPEIVEMVREAVSAAFPIQAFAHATPSFPLDVAAALPPSEAAPLVPGSDFPG